MFNYLIQSYTPGRNMTRFDDDAFMNFAPDMKKHNLSDSDGSYLSRFNNDTSHIILTIGLESIINYKSIYLTVIIFDFMSYASPSISNLIHIFENTMVQSRKIFKERIIKAVSIEIVVRQSTEYAYTYFWMSLRGHKKISSKYSLYIEL